MERIGIFGGSFNPPHLGHVQAVTEARRELGLDRVLLIPAAIPPHKQLPPHSPDAATRLELTRLAVAALPWAEACDIELRRQGPSYTVDTLRALTQAHPGDELVLLVGTDMFLTLHQWYQSAEICRLARIAFADRTDSEPGRIAAQKELLERTYGARVTVLHNEVRELSSTTVRRMLAFGCGEELLPEAVYRAIVARRLYQSPAQLRQLPLPELETVCVGLLKERRIPHVLGCRDTAVALAQRYGCDVVAAGRAALLHDVTKALDFPQQLQLCAHYGMISADLTRMQPQLLHAASGALVAERVFGETPEVVGAVRWHTTGKPAMTTLEKVLYLADMIEPTRSYDGVEALREAAWRDLDEGLTLSMRRTVTYLQERGVEVSPETGAALAYLLRTKL